MISGGGMNDHDGQVFAGIAAGLGEAITQFMLRTGADLTTIEAVRSAGLRRIANWEPSGIAMPDQVAVAREAMALFEDIYREAAARALVLEAAGTQRRRRAARKPRRAAEKAG